MARKRTKKLNIHDIHKNNDVEVSHAIQKIKENLTTKFANKGGNVVEKNNKAIDQATASIEQLKLPFVDFIESIPNKKSFQEKINDLEGESLPVSEFINMPDGGMEPATSKYDKADTSAPRRTARSG